MSYKKLRKKMLAGMLVMVMTCSSVATDGFGTVVHDMVKVKAKAYSQKEVQEEAVVEATEVNANEYGLADNIQDGTILHCFDWKYSLIKEELPDIAAVNHLHNAFVGEKDYYVNGGSAAAVYRETGAVIPRYNAVGLQDLTYKFGNERNSFSYPEEYKIPFERYQYIYGETVLAKSHYEARGKWGGNCFGMTSTSVLFYAGTTNLQFKDFNSTANYIKDLNITDGNQKLQLTLAELIEIMQVAQFDSKVQKSIIQNGDKLDELCQKVIENQNSNGLPVLICLYGPEGGHAVVGYKVENNQLYIYDPNFPNTTRTIELKKNEEGKYSSWLYNINDVHEWKTEREGCWISYIPYEEYKKVWEERSSDRYVESSVNVNMLGLSVDNAIIYDEGGNQLAEIKDGALQTRKEDIYEVHEITGIEESQSSGIALYLPTDTYVIENTDKDAQNFTADMTHVNQGVSVTTQADKVTFNVNDEKRISGASCNIEKGQSYNVSLLSTYEDDKKNVEVSGIGTVTGEVGISQSKGNLDLKNCDQSNIIVNGEKADYYVISAKKAEGGRIAFQGNQTVTAGNNIIVRGEKATYVILPEDGYVLSDVLVDGKSMGAVSTYSFENVESNHNITAVFEKYKADAITIDKIKSQTHTGNAVIPAVTVRMNNIVLKENVDYSLLYSNNIEVGTAKVSIIGIGSYKGFEKTLNFTIAAAKGESYTISGMKYQVTDSVTKQVMFVSLASKKKTSVTIPKTVKIGATIYKVTKIAAKAFNGCSKLKKINVKSTYLTSIGSNAFKGIYKNAVIKVPAAELTKYKKLMKNKGQKKTVTIKK